MTSILGPLVILVFFFSEIQMSSGMWKSLNLKTKHSQGNKQDQDRRNTIATPRRMSATEASLAKRLAQAQESREARFAKFFDQGSSNRDSTQDHIAPERLASQQPIECEQEDDRTNVAEIPRNRKSANRKKTLAHENSNRESSEEHLAPERLASQQPIECEQEDVRRDLVAIPKAIKSTRIRAILNQAYSDRLAQSLAEGNSNKHSSQESIQSNSHSGWTLAELQNANQHHRQHLELHNLQRPVYPVEQHLYLDYRNEQHTSHSPWNPNTNFPPSGFQSSKFGQVDPETLYLTTSGLNPCESTGWNNQNHNLFHGDPNFLGSNTLESYNCLNQNQLHHHAVYDPSGLNPLEAQGSYKQNQEGHYGGSSSSFNQDTNFYNIGNPSSEFGTVDHNQLEYTTAALREHYLAATSPSNSPAVDHLNQYHANHGRVSGSGSGSWYGHYK